MISTEDWRKTLLRSDATLKEAIGNLDASGAQIILVVSDGDILVGTLTDGDIRRGLLKDLSLDSTVASIIHREAMVVPRDMARDMVMHMMQANQVNALPVVDDARRVVGLHLLNELLVPVRKPNVMVIMAGGKGTRLLPHTENCPKPLLPVAGKPMLERIIEHAKADGFAHFILAVHYLGHMIEEYFGDGSKWHVKIDYLREESPLGTAGAISLLLPHPELPFLVTNGDVLTDIRYSELLDFHCRHAATATMAVKLHEWQHPFGVVHVHGVDIVGFEEKPIARSHINAGIYVLDPSAFDVLEIGKHCDMPTLFGRLKDKKFRTIVYPMHEPWLDVGRIADFERAQHTHISNT